MKRREYSALNIISVLTSESAPLSAPGHVKVTYSWHRLWTTKLQTETQAKRVPSFPLQGHLGQIVEPMRSVWPSYLGTDIPASRSPCNNKWDKLISESSFLSKRINRVSWVTSNNTYLRMCVKNIRKFCGYFW